MEEDIFSQAYLAKCVLYIEPSLENPVKGGLCEKSLHLRSHSIDIAGESKKLGFLKMIILFFQPVFSIVKIFNLWFFALIFNWSQGLHKTVQGCKCPAGHTLDTPVLEGLCICILDDCQINGLLYDYEVQNMFELKGFLSSFY